MDSLEIISEVRLCYLPCIGSLNYLKIIIKRFNLDEDVAGATFMAAGSSAPEVFISLIGTIFHFFHFNLVFK